MSIHLDTIKLNDRNPRSIGDKQFHRLCDSIKRDPEFMLLRPIVVDRDGVILGGNQRYRACLSLGMTEVPSDWVVRATDLTPEQRKRFVVLDNAPDGMAGEWDWDILGADWEIPELEELGLSAVEAVVKEEPEAKTAKPPSGKFTFPPRVWLVQRDEIIAALQPIVEQFGGVTEWPE